MFYKKKQSKDGYDFWCKDCWRTKENSRNKSSKRYLEKNEYFTGSDLNKLLMNARKRANIKGLDLDGNIVTIKQSNIPCQVVGKVII